ncbi:MAG: hypothetical protein KatS3mg027_1220 [Bacteroidia bacterium]|nr:MAG: hypothetical protein KatS3mg027_1220 [Bacteroidia bacterium]
MGYGIWMQPLNITLIIQAFQVRMLNADPCDPQSLPNPGGQGAYTHIKRVITKSQFQAILCNALF